MILHAKCVLPHGAFYSNLLVRYRRHTIAPLLIGCFDRVGTAVCQLRFDRPIGNLPYIHC